jgi:hypothetical protein
LASFTCFSIHVNQFSAAWALSYCIILFFNWITAHNFFLYLLPLPDYARGVLGLADNIANDKLFNVDQGITVSGCVFFRMAFDRPVRV